MHFIPKFFLLRPFRFVGKDNLGLLQGGIGTMVSEGARPWGRGRSQFAEVRLNSAFVVGNGKHLIRSEVL